MSHRPARLLSCHNGPPDSAHSSEGAISGCKALRGQSSQLTDWSMQMSDSKHARWSRATGALLAAGLLALSGVALATDQAQQRRDGRDAKQDSKEKARQNKVDCKAADQKNNAECRQDKRDTKQGGRQEKRDIKH